MSEIGSSCERYADDLAGVALGASTGRERAAVLAHIEGCRRCAAEVEELAHAADALLEIAPEAEPPLGFEVRLLARLGIDPATATPPTARQRQRQGSRSAAQRSRIGQRSRSFVLAAAAVLVVAVGLGFSSGWLAGHSGPSGPPAKVAGPTEGALLDADGTAVGQVVTSSGAPAMLFMVVEGHDVYGKVICRVELTDGKTVTLGTFWIDDGWGTWTSPLSVPASSVKTAELIDTHGAIVATATLS